MAESRRREVHGAGSGGRGVVRWHFGLCSCWLCCEAVAASKACSHAHAWTSMSGVCRQSDRRCRRTSCGREARKCARPHHPRSRWYGAWRSRRGKGGSGLLAESLRREVHGAGVGGRGVVWWHFGIMQLWLCSEAVAASQACSHAHAWTSMSGVCSQSDRSCRCASCGREARKCARPHHPRPQLYAACRSSRPKGRIRALG